MATTKDKLLGCFEICLFMKEGVNKFGSSKQESLRSFLIPILFMPLALYVSALVSDSSESFFTYILKGVQIVIGYGLFLTLVYLGAKQFQKQENFPKFVTAYNWITLPLMLFVLPIIFIVFTGGNYEGLKTYAVFITIISYVFTGFIATYALRLPWELGAVVAVISMAIEEVLSKVTEYLLQT